MKGIAIDYEWLHESVGFGVKVDGIVVFTSKYSIACDAVVLFIHGTPGLAEAFVQGAKQ